MCECVNLLAGTEMLKMKGCQWSLFYSVFQLKNRHFFEFNLNYELLDVRKSTDFDLGTWFYFIPQQEKKRFWYCWNLTNEVSLWK